MSVSHQIFTQAVSSSRRNSFDFVVDTANARAANDNPAGHFNRLTTPDLKGTVSRSAQGGSFASQNRNSQPFDVDIEAQEGRFEEIELQEWPTESRLAAMHSSGVALTDRMPPSSSRQINVPSPTPVFTASTKSRGCDFWGKFFAVFGL